jgi:PAS domain S-box-containing protein
MIRLDSLRARLLLLVVLAVAPALALLGFTALEQRRATIAQIESSALAAARFIAVDQQQVIEGGRQLLVALAQLPVVTSRDAARCDAALAEMLRRLPVYGNLGVVAADGQVICTAVPITPRPNVADRRYFKEALARNGFAIGEYQIGRVTGKPTLTFGYPVAGAAGRAEAVVFAALDLAWLQRGLGEITLPAGATLVVVSRGGDVLASQGPAPRRLDGATLDAMRAQREGILRPPPDADGPRLLAFAPLLGAARVDTPWVAVAVSTDVAVRPVTTALLRNVAVLLLATAVILAIAWVASDRLVLRHVRALLRTARRFGAGDLRARTGRAGGSGEVAELAQAFDEMADGIARVSEQNRRILDSVGEGIYGLDRRGRVTFVNPAAARLSGYAVEELLGAPMHVKIHHSRADGRPYPPEECPSAQTLAEGATRYVDDDVFWRRDGTSFPVEYVSTPITRDGVVEGAVVAFKDVSDRRRAEAELQRQRELLQQTEKVATMGSLLAGVAHELNNPLAVVMGQTDLLRETVTDPVLLRRAEAIKIGADRCARIVRNFLSLARNRPPQRAMVALHQVVREAVELLGYELRTSGVSVDLQLGEAIPPLWADGHQLHQVLVNLLGNARHAMRQSTAPRRVVIRTAFDAATNRVRVEVSDTGPGIPAEIQAKIFEPFFTTKQAGEGTGLGLSLSRGIIQEHGGTIAVRSAPDAGTTFTIELPVVTRAEDETPGVTAVAAQRGPRGNILVVDDEADLAVTLADALALDGHAVDTALDGTKALELLAQNSYDLVLTDTKMPLLDGAGLYAAIRARFPSLGDRLVFITGDLLDSEKQAFLASTGATVVPKPFDIADVRALVRRLLSQAP